MRTIELPYDGLVDVYDGDNINESVKVITDELNNVNYFYKGKKNRKKWYNVVTSFDIETTKIKNDYYTKDMAKMYEFFNITFCWQFGINDKFIFGRHVENFFKILDAVNKLVDGYFCCFIHNFAYEFNNLADYFAKGDEIFFKNKSTPLFARYGFIEFRCTAQLTHKSLAQLGNEINYGKLVGDFDYNVPRTPNNPKELTALELNYCYRDIMVLNKYVSRETINYCTKKEKHVNPVLLPYTQTGYVRKDVKRNFSQTGKGHEVLEHCQLTYDEYIDVRPSFWGGYTHTNFRHIGARFPQIRHKDITSAYPSVMVRKLYPYKLTEVDNLDNWLYEDNLKRENYAQIATLVLYGVILKRGHVPYIPYSKGSAKVSALNENGSDVVIENGKLITADVVRLTVCDVDARLIFANYDVDDFEVEKLYTGIKKPLPYNVISTVINYFNGKTTLKGVDGEEYNYGLSKQLLNGIYGVSAQDLITTNYEIGENFETVATENEYNDAKVLPYQWSIYTTAYVREIIYGLITYICNLGGEDSRAYIYCDTDSIFYIPNKKIDKYIDDYNNKVIAELQEMQKKYFDIIPKNPKGEPQYLGTLQDEEDDCIEFCCIGAKRYYIKHSDGTYDITFSGLRATKTKKVDGKRVNGFNTQRLIEVGNGDLYNAFIKIKDDSVILPYIEGFDKLSNYNVRAPFKGSLFGETFERPCSFTLYGQGVTLSLNADLKAFLFNDILYNEVY